MSLLFHERHSADIEFIFPIRGRAPAWFIGFKAGCVFRAGIVKEQKKCLDQKKAKVFLHAKCLKAA